MANLLEYKVIIFLVFLYFVYFSFKYLKGKCETHNAKIEKVKKWSNTKPYKPLKKGEGTELTVINNH